MSINVFAKTNFNKITNLTTRRLPLIFPKFLASFRALMPATKSMYDALRTLVEHFSKYQKYLCILIDRLIENFSTHVISSFSLGIKFYYLGCNFSLNTQNLPLLCVGGFCNGICDRLGCVCQCIWIPLFAVHNWHLILLLIFFVWYNGLWQSNNGKINYRKSTTPRPGTEKTIEYEREVTTLKNINNKL